jgi:hypothetical protein
VANSDPGASGNEPGVGGASGSPSGSGYGGNPFQCVPQPVCGNAVAERSGPGDFICVEECDGGDVSGANCESLGYVGGSLACADCRFETSSCVRCQPLDEELVSCTADSAITRYRPLIAATDEEIAVVWQDIALRVWFQRFGPDLSPIDAPRLLSEVEAAFDLEATPSGWMLAVQSSAAKILTLDASGAVVGSMDVARDVLWATDYGPTLELVPRLGAGPLLLWREIGRDETVGSELHAALIAADGSSALAVGKVGDLADADFAAVYATDGFLVVARLEHACDALDCEGGLASASGSGGATGMEAAQSGIGGGGGAGGNEADQGRYPAWATIRVGLDAQRGEPRLLAAQGFQFPALVPTPDGGIAVVFQGFLSDVWVPAWEKLDATGALVAGPVEIGPFRATVGPSLRTLVALGTGNVLVTAAGETTVAISYMQIDGEGTSLGPMKRIVSDPNVFDSRAVRRGPDIVVAWGSPFGLARLALNEAQ